VTSYVGRPTAARAAFLDCADTHPVEELKSQLRRAATYMEWIAERQLSSGLIAA
jgi:hypothetical protein